MKRTLLLCVLLVLSGTLYAQQDFRIKVKGQIIVPEEDDPEGITVYNTTSNIGTITNSEGEFTIAVKKNDRLLFNSLQFNDIIVIVDEGIMKTLSMTLSLSETVNVMDAVVVRPYDLSGNITVDVSRVNTQDTPDARLTSSVASIENQYVIAPDAQSEVENLGITRAQLTDGINFVNIFKAIVKKRPYDVEESVVLPNIDAELRTMYDDVFFQRNFDIPMDEINQFIFYAEQHGLESEMLKKGRELDLIEFLMDTSKSYASRSKN
ncbi:hypothetical protein [Croceiramulus getboli]|nr:hypothetical protein P8624_01225 [Flavobacteriaceae bacterium YJPT1-3]